MPAALGYIHTYGLMYYVHTCLIFDISSAAHLRSSPFISSHPVLIPSYPPSPPSSPSPPVRVRTVLREQLHSRCTASHHQHGLSPHAERRIRSSGGAAPTTSGTSGRPQNTYTGELLFRRHRDVMNYLVGPAAHVAPPPLPRIHTSRERRMDSRVPRDTEGSGKGTKKSWK